MCISKCHRHFHLCLRVNASCTSGERGSTHQIYSSLQTIHIPRAQHWSYNLLVWYIMDPAGNFSTLDADSCYNLSGNNSIIVHEMDGSLSLVYFIAPLAICGIGIILNSLVIIVIVYGKLMRTSVFMILLLVLAVFDNLTLCCSILQKNGIYGLLPLSSSLWLCSSIMFGMVCARNVSSWLIVFITVERFIAIFHPFKVHVYCTVRRSITAISLLVIVMCMIIFPLLFSSNISEVGGMTICYPFGSGSLLEILYNVFLACVYSIIPFCIISVLNILIIKESRGSEIIISNLMMLKQKP